MAEIGPQSLAEVKATLECYVTEVEASKLSQSSQKTYLLHARQFVRWLKNDFPPGGAL